MGDVEKPACKCNQVAHKQILNQAKTISFLKERLAAALGVDSVILTSTKGYAESADDIITVKRAAEGDLDGMSPS